MQSECMLHFGSFHFVVVGCFFSRLCEYFIAYVSPFNSKLM